jgi:hypothetical protein
MTDQTGQCLCGNVKYKLTGDLMMTGICHCKNCQRQAGSAFSTLAGVAVSDLVFTEGKPKLYKDSATESGGTVERYFCGDCGSPIYSKVPGNDDVVYLKTGTMDDTSDFNPQFHVWYGSKQSWVEGAEGTPTMEKQS